LVFAQNIAITDDDAYIANSSAMLDVKSLTKGLLIPRLTTAQRTAIVSPANSLLVYDSDISAYFYWTGSSWMKIGTSNNDYWLPDGSNIYFTAGNVGVGTTSPGRKMIVKGSSTNLNEAIFAVQNTDGDTVFAVYPEGVRVWVNDDGGSKASGNRGGFAVGGYCPSKAGFTNEYLRVTPDSVRVYIDDEFIGSKASGNRGGFAVGGFAPSKGTNTDHYLFVQDDSTRVYVADSLQGFGVENIEGATDQRIMKLTTENYFIGHLAGDSITTGLYNSFIGYKAGHTNKSGDNNIFFGYNSGFSNSGGWSNTFIGNSAGYYNDWGYSNVFIGDNAGYSNVSTADNTFVGSGSGYSSIANQNSFFGYRAGTHTTSGTRNTFLGGNTGDSNVNGSNNVYIGFSTGYYAAGSDNVFIGFSAGHNETGSSRLYIDNSNTSSPLIFGEFNNNRVVINGNSANNINNRTFFVNGSAGGTGAWWNDSDIKYKKDITTIENPIDKVMQLRGVYYKWKDESRSEKRQMGFIAQECEGIIPEVVDNSEESYCMQYAPINALLVEAIKDQQKTINDQESRINKLEQQNSVLKENSASIEELTKQINYLKSVIEMQTKK
jgi:hypothetical protein